MDKALSQIGFWAPATASKPGQKPPLVAKPQQQVFKSVAKAGNRLPDSEPIGILHWTETFAKLRQKL